MAGGGVFIKQGVSIGHGAIVGMGAVVTKDVAPYTIVAGNPAKEIRKRFDEQTIELLLASKWWTWDDEKIKRQSAFIREPRLFIRDD